MTSAPYRSHRPTPVSTDGAAVDQEYDYGATTTPTPTSASAMGFRQVQAYHKGENASTPGSTASDSVLDGDEALLDLAQLEELHQEAERMKALGNKHMAAQEYTRAYNAYSAALQLAPVGPSSHVFLSNRAAALLSLKRYAAAATDARRAIALAPTFGKAHARLGQALYFLKDYAGAVQAYEDALEYEPENGVTQTYLDKARAKWDRQSRKARGEEVSVVTENSTVFGNHSIATDPNNKGGVLQSGYRGETKAFAQAAARQVTNMEANSDDPDFDEALKIQKRANRYLERKQYREAIEEYTAALFLVPDDVHLSADLHLGRAHALNGSRRHESAKNDAALAIKLNATPAAYSTLAKSLFYMRDYKGAVKAFTDCVNLLPPGESLGMFDKAYLQKAEAALEEEEASLRKAGAISPAPSPPVPKLPPPRFVPREEAMAATPSIPSMPKKWPQQSPHTPTTLRVGEERTVLCLSESLGIKLNRGADGMVRVLSVTPNTASSPIARQGSLDPGDLVREAAGVDLRRPITNVMWGDTVALIKMAPRPIALVVAEELSPVPAHVLEEFKRAQLPSNSSGEESSRLAKRR